MKPAISNSGYPMIILSSKGSVKMHAVHRLVVKTFLGRLAEKEVNHKDGNKQNPRLNNLEKVTRSENLRHRFYVLGIKSGIPPIGSKHYNSVFTEKDVIKIRNSYKGKRGEYQQLAAKYKVSKSAIAHVIKRHCWNHI